MIRDWWNGWGWAATLTTALIAGIVALTFWVVADASTRVANGRLVEGDHQILATEIYSLHQDVHNLQTQIAGKQ